jgi:hypothetical protein
LQRASAFAVALSSNALAGTTLARDVTSTRRLQMQRRLIWVTLLSVAIAVTALYHTRKVHATPVQDHHRDFSVAGLKGIYAYLRSGSVMGQGARAELGLDLFSGDGKRGIIRNTGASYTVSFDWTDYSWPSGTYTVDKDCTGSLYAADGTKANNIIVLEGGKRFLLLTAGPIGEGKVISGEATRLEEEKN